MMNFIKGKLGLNELWGMLLHVVSPFVTIGQSRGRFQRHSAISIAFYQSIIPHGDDNIVIGQCEDLSGQPYLQNSMGFISR